MRILKISLLTLLGAVVLLVGGAAIYLATLSQDDVKRLVEEQAEKATGRKLTISGPLQYDLSWTPSIRVEDVSFANADWAKDPDMAKIGTLQVDLDLGHVFDGIVIVKHVLLEDGQLSLQREADGRANWIFPGMESDDGEEGVSDKSGSDFTPIIKSVALTNVTVTYSDKQEGQEHQVVVDSVDLDAPDMLNPVQAVVKMSVDGKKIDLAGKLPPAVSLDDAETPLPFDISGEAMGQPFKVAGDLLFVYEDGVPVTISIQDLKAEAFASDLSGDIKVDTTGDKPKLSATLSSQVIDLRTLEALSQPAEPAKKSTTAAKTNRAALFEQEVPTDWLDAAEASVDIEIHQLKSTAAEASEIELTAEMKDGTLSISPLWVTYAGSPIQLEGEVSKKGRDLAAKAKLVIKQADFGRLAGSVIDMPGLEAGGDLNVTLETSGDRVGELIGGAKLNAAAAMPKVRYSDPSLPEAARNVRISKLDATLDVNGTEPDAVMDFFEKVGDIRLETPLEGVVLKGLAGEAHVTAAEVASTTDTIKNLDVSASLRDGVLSLSVPDILLARAHLKASARVEPVGKKIRLSSRVVWNGVDLGVAARRLGEDGTVTGRGSIDLDLKGEGRTIASILSAIDGTFAVDVSKASYLPAGGDVSDKVTLDTLSLVAKGAAEPLTGRIKGAFGGQNADISGTFPSLKMLVDQAKGLPFDITGTVANAQVAVKGDVTLVQAGDKFTSFGVTGLDAKVGPSDLAGSINVNLESALPKVDVALESKLLDLTPYIDDSADTGGSAAAAGKTPSLTEGVDEEALDKPFPVELLGKANGSVELKAGEMRVPGLIVNNLNFHAKLQDKVLTVYPSEGVFNKGLMKIEGKVDGSQAPVADFAVDTTWTDAEFGDAVREYFDTDVISGKGSSSAKLTARGRTPREAMDTVNGHVAIYMKDGTVSNTYWELIAADLVTSLLPSIGKTADTEGKLNCMASRFDITDGVAKSKVFLVDSSRVTVGGDGNINLKDETVDMLLQPRPKDFSFVSLATPIRISGPLTDPSFRPDTEGAAKRLVLGAGAVALTAVNPLALVLPLVNAGSTQDPCPAAIALAEGKSAEEAAKIGEEANKGSGSAVDSVTKPAGEVLNLPGKAVDGVFDGLKNLLK